MSNIITPSTRIRRALHLRSATLVKRIVQSNPAQPSLLQNVAVDDKYNTSLHYAALLGLPDVALFLLDAGHEDGGVSRNLDGATALMLAAAAGPSEDDPVPAGRIAVGKLLLERFPEHAGVRDREGLDAFAHAARHGTNALLVAMLSRPPPPSLLLDGPAAGAGAALHPLLDSRDHEENTPLHHASAYGHLKTLRLLIGAGADHAAVNAYKWTPIDYSATVAAEVYMRGLVRERDQLRLQGRQSPVGGRASPVARLRGDSSDKSRMQRPLGGVRLVSSEGSGTDEEGVDEGSRSQSRARART